MKSSRSRAQPHESTNKTCKSATGRNESVFHATENAAAWTAQMLRLEVYFPNKQQCQKSQGPKAFA